MAGKSEFMKDVLPEILNTVNIIGLISASITVIMVLLLGLYDRRVIDRVTFRIQAGIALLDVVKHVVRLYSYADDELMCEFIGFMKILTDNVYYFLNVSIVVNMQLMFLHGLSPSKLWELAYWLLSLSVGLIITVPFWVLGGFGKNATNICIIKHGTPYTHFITVYLSNGLGLLVLVYCLVIPIMVLRKRRWFGKSFFRLKKHLKAKDITVARKFNKTLNRLILASSLYPLSCFASILGSSVLSISKGYFDYVTPFLFTWALVGRNSTGILNLIAFLLDPTLHRALRSMANDEKLKGSLSKVFGKKVSHHCDEFELGSNLEPSTAPPDYIGDTATQTLCGDQEKNALGLLKYV